MKHDSYNEINREVKEKVAQITEYPVQVITNYVTKFRKKNVVIGNRLHPLVLTTKVTITLGNEEERSM